jgi:hypothetical protein
MRLEKISLNQLKKDLRKLYTKKKRSRFGESSPPGLTEEQIKSQKRDELRRKFKNAAKVAGVGLALLGGVAAAAAGAKVVGNTKAYQTIKNAAVSRVNHETNNAKQKMQTAIQNTQPMVQESIQNAQKSFGGLRNAANASTERTVKDLSKATGNFAGTVVKQTGDALANAATLKGKVTAGLNNALSRRVNELTEYIAPAPR